MTRTDSYAVRLLPYRDNLEVGQVVRFPNFGEAQVQAVTPEYVDIVTADVRRGRKYPQGTNAFRLKRIVAFELTER